jgi:hypothetical protein
MNILQTENKEGIATICRNYVPFIYYNSCVKGEIMTSLGVSRDRFVAKSAPRDDRNIPIERKS